MRLSFFKALLISSLIASFSHAQNERKVEAKAPTPVEKKDDGWHFGVSLGAALGWDVNQSFVGFTDGHFLNVGGKASGFAEYYLEKHEWRNSLSLLEAFTMTPLIPGRLLKSSDALEFDSVYLYHILDWFGAFGQFSLDTSIFANQNVQAADVNYVVGNGQPQLARELALTAPFQPLYLKENIGVFAQPIREEYLLWEARAAAGFMQTFAEGQKVVATTDAAMTPPRITVQTLSSFYQIGPVLGTSVSGKILENKIAYKAGIDVLYVAWQMGENPVTLPSFGDINSFNIDAYAGLSFKLVEWLSLDWNFKALRIPEIVKQWQLQSSLLLTASYAI